MRRTTLAIAAALALGAATISTGVMTTPVMARGMGHGGHVGGARVAAGGWHGGGGGWHGGGWHGGGGGGWHGGGGWRGGGWGPAGVALGLGLGLGGLYAYGGAPYGYCDGYPYSYGYYNNCGYGGYYNGW